MPPTASVRLGITSDRVMWIAVSILVLTISWNGIRVGGGALGDGFMLIAFATVVANHVRERRSPALPSWLVLAGVGFLLAAVLVVIFPPSLGLANRATVQQESLLIVPGYLPPRSDLSFLTKFELSVLLVPLIVAAAATTRRRCRRLLDLWAIGAFVNAAVAVADYVGLAHLAPYPIESDRSSGLTIHPNYLALTAVMGIPAAMMWIGRSRRWSAAGVIAVMTLLGGVYASGSRAGTVAGVGAVLLTGVLVPRFRRGVVPLLPVAGMVLVVLLAFTGIRVITSSASCASPAARAPPGATHSAARTPSWRWCRSPRAAAGGRRLLGHPGRPRHLPAAAGRRRRHRHGLVSDLPRGPGRRRAPRLGDGGAGRGGGRLGDDHDVARQRGLRQPARRQVPVRHSRGAARALAFGDEPGWGAGGDAPALAPTLEIA